MTALLGIESTASFNQAAKHLFRHLHEPHILRRNPIVRRFFEESSSPIARDAQSLDTIHALIRKGAEHLRSADHLAGYDERADRQHSIIVDQCLGKRTIAQVATALGISPAHCYRERADICQRVARYVLEYDRTQTVEYLSHLDEFCLLADYTMNRAPYDDSATAFLRCDKLVTRASSTIQKIEALRVGAFIALHFGDFERAEQARDSADRLSRDGSLTPRDCSLARASVELMNSRFARHRSETKRALGRAQVSVDLLVGFQGDPTPGVRALYVQSLYEMGVALCNLGELEAGHDCLSRAEAQGAFLNGPPSRLSTRAAIELWRLRNHMSLNAASRYPASQRLAALAAAFEHAYSSGWLVEAIAALTALTEQHAYAQNAHEALRMARLAISLASQQSSGQVQAQTTLNVVAPLLSTPSWKDALALLADAPDLRVHVGPHEGMLSHITAIRAFCLNRYDEASRLAARAKTGLQSADLRALVIGSQVLSAAAAHKLGRKQQATELIEPALPAAEKLRAAPILRDAYRVAAVVIGDHRFQQKAEAIAECLTA
jgi:hypothetical protein